MNHSSELLKVSGSWEFQIYSQLDNGLETCKVQLGSEEHSYGRLCCLILTLDG